MQLNDLRGNPNNPRTLSKRQASALDESLNRFGDLGGIVFNRTTGQLVGGHMRVELFKKRNPQVVITDQFDTPNSVGTVATGYILLGDEKYSYREVQWDEVFEAAANLAANKNGGDWDDDKLANMIAQINHENAELLSSTGFDDREINSLLQLSSEPESNDESDNDERLTFKLPSEKVTIVMQAINEAKMHIGKTTEFTDEVNGEALYYLAQHFLESQNGSNFS